MRVLQKSLAAILFVLFSAVFAFGAEPFRILMLTDVHVAAGNQAEKAFRRLANEINRGNEHFSLIVVDGDLTMTGSDEELTLFKNILDSFNLPALVLPGNHESTWSDMACQTIDTMFGGDRFEKKVGDYYLIGFSTGPYMKMGNGHVKAEDLTWLAERLEANASDPKTKVLVFCHYPLFNGLDNWADVTAILKKYNVAGVFCGHHHTLRLANFDGIPGFLANNILKDDGSAQFSVIELDGDWVTFEAREEGKSIGEPFARYKIGTKEILNGIESDLPPDPIVNILPGTVEVVRMRADEASIFGGVAVEGDVVFYGNSLGKIKACRFDDNGSGEDATTGTDRLKDLWSVQWKHSVYSTPVVKNGLLVTGNPEGVVAALSTADGKEIWRIAPCAPVANDMLIDGDTLYTGLGLREFCKVDLSTGKKLWTFDGARGRFQAQPTLNDDLIVFGVWDTNLYALDAKTGTERWRWNNGRKPVANASSHDVPVVLYSPGNVVPAVNEKEVILVAPDRYITALDRETGKERWRTNEYKVREALGQSKDGHVCFAKTMEGHVIAFSALADKLEIIWDCDTESHYDHVATPPHVSDGIVYYGSPEGLVVAMDEKTGEIRWKFQAGHSAVNRFFTDAKHRVWFTLIDGQIYRVTIKKP